jgi:hypothetical protein
MSEELTKAQKAFKHWFYNTASEPDRDTSMRVWIAAWEAGREYGRGDTVPAADVPQSVRDEIDQLKARIFRLERVANMAMNGFHDSNDYTKFIEFTNKAYAENAPQSVDHIKAQKGEG